MGGEKALARAFAHESRRRRTRYRPPTLPPSLDEKNYIHHHAEQVVRWLNAVDRAVEHYRRVRDAA